MKLDYFQDFWSHLTKGNFPTYSQWTTIMVKTYEFRFPPSPKLEKVTVSFDKLINTDLLYSITGLYIVDA